MLTEKAKQILERQAYRVVGKHKHSAVKTCGWTKKMLKGEGGCYKLKFYGIMSHQCMQMTTSMYCANRCTFCWRDYKAPVSKEWKWEMDEPETILVESKEAHHELLSGFPGNPKVTKQMVEQAKKIKHVALSLTGEPITYPKMNALLKLFNKEGVSTFLVTNAQYAEEIKKLNPITQLYLSIDAPNKKILKEVDVPLFKDYWERMNKSLEYLSKKKGRTCIRLTLVKGVNDVEPENYAKLIEKGSPDFIEVKAYMFVGASRQRLKKENMPWHEEVVDFSKKLLEHLDEYEIVSEHIPSRVVLLAKKKFKIDGIWNTWIDFDKWHGLVNSEKDFDVLDFVRKTLQTGLSGRKIKQEVENRKKGIFVNEKTEEIEFWKEEKKKSEGC